jgi:drug/metabolite transporter (DMT)-like permease
MSDEPPKTLRDDSTGAEAGLLPDVSVELPVVVLGGKTQRTGAVRKRRLIPGRVPIHWVSWPMQGVSGLAGALALRGVAEHGEWEAEVVIIAWVMVAAWTWMYAMAWEYRRWLLRWTSILACLLMDAVLALACLDRAVAQEVAPAGRLILREAVPEWHVAGVLMILAAALLLSHIVWFGRGWREVR